MKRRKLLRLIHRTNSLTGLLFEQEEDVFADVGEEEEEGEEEDTGDEGGGDEGPGDEAAGVEGEDVEEEEEEELDVDVAEEVKLSKSIDQDLEALLIDFEADARKSRQISTEEEFAVVEGGLRLMMLVEQDEAEPEADVDYEAEIDLDRFTSEVARLIKNYTTLLDMEKMLVSKAREFIATRYGEDAEEELVSMLDVQHGIKIEEPPSVASGEDSTPVAVGAGTGGAGAAA